MRHCYVVGRINQFNLPLSFGAGFQILEQHIASLHFSQGYITLTPPHEPGFYTTSEGGAVNSIKFTLQGPEQVQRSEKVSKNKHCMRRGRVNSSEVKIWTWHITLQLHIMLPLFTTHSSIPDLHNEFGAQTYLFHVILYLLMIPKSISCILDVSYEGKLSVIINFSLLQSLSHSSVFCENSCIFSHLGLFFHLPVDFIRPKQIKKWSKLQLNLSLNFKIDTDKISMSSLCVCPTVPPVLER